MIAQKYSTEVPAAMDRVVMEHTPMSIGQGSDHGNDSDPESAVSEDLNDDDHDYEVGEFRSRGTL